MALCIPKITNFVWIYKNEWKEHKVWQWKCQKSDFYENKILFKIEEIDVNKIFVSIKESYGAKNTIKYFFGYSDNNEIKPICIRLPQMIGYAKYFDDNKTMSFKVTDK